MTEHNTFPGSVYAVTCKDGCAVTDASGELDMYCEAGGQLHVTAPSDKLYTSAPASVRKVNFKHALAALGLLGGGDTLPAGYIKAEFLEFTGTQYFRTSLTIPNLRAQIKYQIVTTKNCVVASVYRNYIPFGHYGFQQQNNSKGAGAIASLVDFGVQQYDNPIGAIIEAEFDYSRQFCRVNALTKYGTVTPADDNPVLFIGAQNGVGSNETYGIADSFFTGRILSFEAWYGTAKATDFVPILNEEGTACFFDRASGKLYKNNGTGSFIVGFTLKQAQQLSKLPSGGGELTISLPSNWQEDAAVVDALATAEGKWWVLTIQTYEAEAGAASTFALRRIWVRKRAEQNGYYVAADGTRWQIDWCATMVGGDPQEHGYEPFRSVEAAAAYWELVPYVAPETEQLLTD